MLNPFKSQHFPIIFALEIPAFSQHFCHFNPSIFPALLLGESPLPAQEQLEVLGQYRCAEPPAEQKLKV